MNFFFYIPTYPFFSDRYRKQKIIFSRPKLQIQQQLQENERQRETNTFNQVANAFYCTISPGLRLNMLKSFERNRPRCALHIGRQAIASFSAGCSPLAIKIWGVLGFGRNDHSVQHNHLPLCKLQVKFGKKNGNCECRIRP